MKRKLWALLLIGMLVCCFSLVGKTIQEKPLVQIAILLDTSGSMEGLIEQAKTQLWKIVNEMALAKKQGVGPKLEVALYEYGKSTIPESEGYLRMIVPLSEDLDRISEELFKLTTNGGDEYCGRAIQAAVKGLTWTPSNKELKIIFIAGNEPFTQGGIDYRQSCKEAISQGIMVNTIFCGDYQTGIQTNWKDGADLADGNYMNIDQNQKIVHIPAPQDTRIVELGQSLNKTYLAYGQAGEAKKERQAAQDQNALGSSPSVMVERAKAKSSAQYSNVGWDLVDAEKEGQVKLEDVKDEDLPAEMKKMSKPERRQYLDKMKKQREEIQKDIQKLTAERDKFVAQKKKELTGDNTLDAVMIKAVREQAEKKSFEFEKK
jgi:hypothetical protein